MPTGTDTTTPSESSLGTLAPLVAGVITAFTAAFTALFALGGIGAQIARNERQLGLAALVLLVTSVAISIGALIAHRDRLISNVITNILTPISIVLFFVGTVVAIFAAARSSSGVTQPLLSANVVTSNGASAIEVEAKTNGLPTDQQVTIAAYAFMADGTSPNLLFTAAEGPDNSGSVDAKFSMPMPHDGRSVVQIQAWTGGSMPSCDAKERDPNVRLGCLLIQVPAQDQIPHLAVGVDGDPKTRVLSAKVKQTGLAAGQSISLAVIGASAGSAPTVIYQAVLYPDGAGTVDDALPIPVPQAVTDVCVVARSKAPATPVTCPPSSSDQNVAWSRLTFASS